MYHSIPTQGPLRRESFFLRVPRFPKTTRLIPKTSEDFPEDSKVPKKLIMTCVENRRCSALYQLKPSSESVEMELAFLVTWNLYIFGKWIS